MSIQIGNNKQRVEYVTVWENHEPTKLHWGVPVVRCRDCKHNARGICKVFDYCDIPNLDNGFCAWGERKNYE